MRSLIWKDSRIVILLLLVCIIIAIKKVFPKKKRIASVRADFDYSKAEPRKIRPFFGKKNFAPSMGIKNLSNSLEEWLLIENTYATNTKLRKEVVEKYTDKVLHTHDSERVHLAVKEFYSKVFEFLLERYPMCFKKKGNKIYNSINDIWIPYSPDNISSRELQLILAANIEEDFLILMKDDPSDENEEYKLRASVTGFPSGFDPSHGFDKPISYIHEPVPQYEKRLKLSMGRFFNRLKPIDLWERTNWSIQTHNNIFTIKGNHAYGSEKVRELDYEELDFDSSVFLRVERQLFSRLPKSGANLMTVRTYLTPLPQIKDEKLSESLIFAIDNLPDDLAHYKKKASWGRAVKEYLSK